MMARWFSRDWWHYLTVLWCRYCGHPKGYGWFNAGGDGPDYRCRECGDWLG